MTTIFKKFAIGTTALVLMTTVFASAAMAAGTTTTITPGELKTSEITVSPFKDNTSGTAVDISAGLKLTGKTQTLTTAIDAFDITDATGSGSGWNVAISATQFSQSGTSPKMLVNGALKLTGTPSITLVDLNSDAETGIAKPLAVPASIDGSTVTLLSAPAGEGQGSYRVAALPLELTLKPSEVYAGTYGSTVTVTLTATP